MEYPISLDTALQIVGSLKVRAIKEKSATNDSDTTKPANKVTIFFINFLLK